MGEMSKVKYQPLDAEDDDDEGSGLLMSDDRDQNIEGGASADVKATPTRNTADGNDDANSSCIGGGGEGDNGDTDYSAYFFDAPLMTVENFNHISSF